MIKGFTIGGCAAHPTKGYRGLARPRKANGGRRKLIPTGVLAFEGNSEHNRRERYYKSGRWPRMNLAERQMMKARGWS